MAVAFDPSSAVPVDSGTSQSAAPSSFDPSSAVPVDSAPPSAAPSSFDPSSAVSTSAVHPPGTLPSWVRPGSYEAQVIAAHPQLANPTGPNGLEQLGGAAEAGMHFASGAVAPFAGGLTFLGALALTRGNVDAAKAVQQATEGAITYQPRGATGQAIVGGIGSAAQATIGRATDYLSDKAADIGGPVAGAAVRTTLEGAPYVVGLGPELSVARGAVGAVANPAAAARAVVEAARNAVRPVAVTNEGAASAAAIEGGVAVARTPTPSPLDHVVGASAATPPTFEAPTSPAAAAPAAAASPEATASTAAPESAATAPPTTFAPETQTQRQATLQEVGLTNVRESAITGDKKAAATDYQQSKLDSEGGQELTNAFSNERASLDNYSDKLVSDAGGSLGLDETSLHNRGATILKPFQDLSDSYDAQIKNLYQQADARAQGVPADLNATTAKLADRASFIGTTEGQQLLRGVSAYLRQSGIADDAGTIGSATVQQAEGLRKYVNDQYTPRTARLIQGIKDSIDDDVTKSAGDDIYQGARALRTVRANMLDNPQGVATLLESSGPQGINRAVNVERIPDTIARMPVDQFGHIVDTLQGVAPELKQQAQAALGEIRSQFMLRMQEKAQQLKGAWNNRGVTQYLNQNSAKLAKVFSPAELARMRTLNSAGHILDVDRSYPGAVAQGHNLFVRGALGLLERGGEAAGAHFGGPVGAVVGGAGAGKIAHAISNALTRKAARARVVNLNTYVPKGSSAGAANIAAGRAANIVPGGASMVRAAASAIPPSAAVGAQLGTPQ